MTRPRLVVLLAALLALTGCASSSEPAADGSQGSPAASAPRPTVCPATLPSGVGSSSGQVLVPGHPFATVVCHYADPGSDHAVERSILDAHRTMQLARLLDALPPAPQGVFNCPNESTTPLALYFNESGSDIQRVIAATTGCRFASNGTVTGAESKPLQSMLSRIAG